MPYSIATVTVTLWQRGRDSQERDEWKSTEIAMLRAIASQEVANE